MSQPIWKTIYNTDYSRLLRDTTEAYPPELEIAQEYEDEKAKGGRRTKFMFYRFPVERMKTVQDSKDPEKFYVVNDRYDPSTYRGPISSHEEWFIKDLPAVARSVGSSTEDFVAALCSEDPGTRAEVYEAVGSYHGYDNFDSSPQVLTETKLNKKWA